MSERTTATPPVPAGEATPAAPTRVGAGFVTLYALAYFGIWLAALAPAVVTLQLKVLRLYPDDATSVTGVVSGVGALFALVGNPWAGKLSDRCTSRFGMRRPFVLGGMLGGTLGTAVIIWAPNMGMLIVGCSIVQLAYNTALAGIVAVVPDQVPEDQRGKFSGLLGLCQFLALGVAAYAVDLVAGNMALMFAVPALFGLLAVVPLLVVLRDRVRTEKPATPYGVKEFLASFWVNPVARPGYAWAWLSRFLLVLGWATLMTYQAFLLIDRFGYTPDNVGGQVGVVLSVMVVGILAGSAGGGWLSDRLGRRKVFVGLAGVIAAIGLPTVAVAQSMTLLLTGVAVVGLGIGLHMSVDLALVLDVLPDDTDVARDLGVFNIANALPQSIAPAIAPFFLALGAGQNYTALFLAAAGFAVLGALAVRPVRGVR
ncbi:MAG TPA: MFS transporter [Streptomyces sp.]